MNQNAAYLLTTLGTSLVTALVIFMLPERYPRVRTAINLIAAIAKLLLVSLMLWGVFHGQAYSLRVPLALGLELYFHSDSLSMLFAALSSVLWLATTVYAVGYLERGPHCRRFFGFFSLCVTATMGIAFAGDLVTFLVFYELLTLSTYPLVVHSGTSEAMRAGRAYLAYTLGGGLLIFAAVGWVYAALGVLRFTEGGAPEMLALPRAEAVLLFALFMAGLGVKAALVPLHGWLPKAMVAPAPVSALLHAVAVVKAGAFGIVRVIYDLFGVKHADALGVTGPLAIAAAVTILYGSIQALRQNNLKRRLAYSTVSQVSYIVLGAAVVGTGSTIAAVAHLVHQGLMKSTLFFCAGSLSKHLHIYDVGQLKGVGKRMPWTMGAFTAGALGMIGVPPTAGFTTKWYLGVGSAEEGSAWVLAILVLSTVLNAAYFLPLLKSIWFDETPEHAGPTGVRSEGLASLLAPILLMALLSLASGTFAATAFSPLGWAKLIAEREPPASG